MTDIEFPREEKQHLVGRIQRYCREELDVDLGRFDAEFLMEFVSRELGAYFYNRGLADARAVLQGKLQDIDDALYEIEKPTELTK